MPSARRKARVPTNCRAASGKTGQRQGRAGQGRAGQGRAGHSRAGQGRAQQGRAQQGRAQQGRAQQGRAGQGRAGQGTAGQGRAGQGRAGHSRAGQGKGRAGQGRAGQGRAGQGRGRARAGQGKCSSALTVLTGRSAAVGASSAHTNGQRRSRQFRLMIIWTPWSKSEAKEKLGRRSTLTTQLAPAIGRSFSNEGFSVVPV